MIKHKNIYKQLFVFLTAVMVLASCIEDKAFNDKKITILKANLKAINKETETILNAFIVKQQVSYPLKPYTNLSTRLNSLILNNIDTNLNGNYSDTIKLKEKLAELKAKYMNVIDSCIKASQFALFLASDYNEIKAMTFDFLPISKIDNTLNYYFSIQSILNKHQKQLKLFLNYTSYGCGFYRLYDFGYMICVYEDAKSTQLKVFYKYPERYAKFNAIKCIKIENSNGQLTQLNESKVVNDTCYFFSPKLPKGNYTAFVKYDIINMNGEKNTNDLEFPFSTK